MNSLDLEEQLRSATDDLDASLDALRVTEPAPHGELVAWVGGEGRGRSLLLSWSEGRSTAESPTLTLSLWSDRGYGTRYPIKNAAITMKLSEIPALARAILAALVRGKAAAIDRGERDREYRALRQSGGVR